MRWGIAGPGGIATRFADAMPQVTGGEIVAVASRSAERAAAFADRYSIAARYDDYHRLAADDRVEAVYVATPHVRHEADTRLFLAAGKHVLCEKPFALNAGQARRMVATAREHGRFLMEAIWSRFLPSYAALGDVLTSGRIGEPLLVEGDFGFRRPVQPEHRLFDPALGGGALLDLGIYPLQLCQLVLGNPERVLARGVLGQTGVDESVVAVLGYPSGATGVVTAAIRVATACTARISGSDGWVELPSFMHRPDHLTVGGPGGVERLDTPWDGHGLHFQIEAVQRCVRDGLLESPIMPLADTVALAETMDRIRAEIGLVYPGDLPSSAELPEPGGG